MNKAILIGNLTKDPESRATVNGKSVCTFSIAVNRRYKDPDGNQPVDYIPIVTWNRLAEHCAKHLAKGKKVAVIGEIQTRSYEAKDGTKRYVTEVVSDEVQFLFSPTKEPQELSGFEEVNDEDLPFK